MADFRQLALEFVLADDEAKQTALAGQAAQGLSPARASQVCLTDTDFLFRDKQWFSSFKPSCKVGGGCTAVDAWQW